MKRLTAKKHTSYGLKSTGYNIYSHGHMIGTCAGDDVNQVLDGDLTLVCPVHNWRDRFSISLKKEMGLPIGRFRYDDKGEDRAGSTDGQCLSCFI